MQKGKLPADVIEISYGKEYGEDIILSGRHNN